MFFTYVTIFLWSNITFLLNFDFSRFQILTVNPENKIVADLTWPPGLTAKKEKKIHLKNNKFDWIDSRIPKVFFIMILLIKLFCNLHYRDLGKQVFSARSR